MSDYLTTWRHDEKGRKAHELARRYHAETEAYDRTVCTGPIINGGVMPMNAGERALVIRNASAAHKRVMSEAMAFGIERADMIRAIAQYA